MVQNVSLHRPTKYLPRWQAGVTLIVALVMLLVMTSLGITTMTGATLQERMAGNSRQQYIARLNAEFALRTAEDQLAAQNLNATTDSLLGALIANTDGWYAPVQVGAVATSTVPFAANMTTSSSWATGPSDTNTNSVRIAEAGANNPRYVVEYIGKYDESKTQQVTIIGKGGPNTRPYIFRITAIGWGSSQHQNSVSVLKL
jgi:type IV pilus assembly protein PilX